METWFSGDASLSGAIVDACENWAEHDLPHYPEEQAEDFSGMGECVRAAIDEMET